MRTKLSESDTLDENFEKSMDSLIKKLQSDIFESDKCVDIKDCYDTVKAERYRIMYDSKNRLETLKKIIDRITIADISGMV